MSGITATKNIPAGYGGGIQSLPPGDSSTGLSGTSVAGGMNPDDPSFALEEQRARQALEQRLAQQQNQNPIQKFWNQTVNFFKQNWKIIIQTIALVASGGYLAFRHVKGSNPNALTSPKNFINNIFNKKTHEEISAEASKNIHTIANLAQNNLAEFGENGKEQLKADLLASLRTHLEAQRKIAQNTLGNSLKPEERAKFVDIEAQINHALGLVQENEGNKDDLSTTIQNLIHSPLIKDGFFFDTQIINPVFNTLQNVQHWSQGQVDNLRGNASGLWHNARTGGNAIIGAGAWAFNGIVGVGGVGIRGARAVGRGIWNSTIGRFST